MSIYKISDTVTYALFDWKEKEEAQDWVEKRLSEGKRVFIVDEFGGDDIMDSYSLFTGPSAEAILNTARDDGDFNDPPITKLSEVTTPAGIS